ncbi:MAG: hypothetical protein A2W99_13000 [Bacteroidetes bacterium GWF2_33_16]|nr:MAG: hypothetical protein A2X00_01275 [Bacteroidetes bacterium GWE2_32_14]OFY06599.1 MAG: hypothetical protein A2W99_13000 [Bacteroidetes bacterium GWF2_33_16]
MIKHQLNQFFSFTKKERNGIIVLLFFCIALLIARSIILRSSVQKISLNDSEFIAEIEKFEKSLELKELKNESVPYKISKEKKWSAPETLIVFDPNTINVEELKILGFTEKQISTILNYRNKGGRFVTKKDLQKIYGITKDQYETLEPYIQIKANENFSLQSKKEVEKFKPIKTIEINSVSESDLTQLNGIGISFAKRICKYREILGGFYNKEQLLEVYGMDTLRYNQFIHQIIIDTSLIIKSDLNLIKYDELIKRQYLSKYQVQAILKYRDLKGKFNKLEELVENNLVSEVVYIKVKPYFIIK